MQFFTNNVVFIRHGETEWNLQNRSQGQMNSPLTEKGILQAKEVAEKLNGQKFDVIISSPLGRAFETAKIISEKLSIPNITTDFCLAERNLGILQGSTNEEAKKKFPNLWDENGKFIYNSIIPDAELLEDFLQRIQKGIENLKKVSQTKNVLVVTHDGVLYGIVSKIKEINFSDVLKTYKFNNCEPIILS